MNFVACFVLPSVRFGAVVGALGLWSSEPLAQACLQGYQFQPHKLLAPPAEAPILPRDAVKFDPPKIEPVKFDGLLGPVTPQPLAPKTAAEALAAGDREEDEIFTRYIREFETRPALGQPSFEDRTDYAVALVHIGRTPAAIAVLLSLEKERPGIYTTAANLGTAYELAGDLNAALAWIARGIERDPKSHDATEWLHLAILRAKINLQADADWLKRHTVLEGSETRTTADVSRAIEYQLHERLHFVKPADAVVCDLFYQAAVRADGEKFRGKRSEWLRESLRFGDWRRSEAEALLKS